MQSRARKFTSSPFAICRYLSRCHEAPAKNLSCAGLDNPVVLRNSRVIAVWEHAREPNRLSIKVTLDPYRDASLQTRASPNVDVQIGRHEENSTITRCLRQVITRFKDSKMKHLIVAMAVWITTTLTACTPLTQPTATQVIEPAPTAVSDVGEEAEVRDLVESFGKRLQMVSLLAPNAAQDLQKQYSEFVSPALLETWMKDVSKAPGRIVSSPWPDRIEITTLAKEGPSRYVINGFVVEITSTEVVSGGAANKIPVHMVVEKDQEHWLVTEYTEEH